MPTNQDHYGTPRSRWLAPIPPTEIDQRLTQWLRRIILATVFLTILALLIFSIRLKWWPQSGLGFLLYWLHDQVYLVLKGYLWTLIAPWGILLWGMLAIVALLILFGRPLLDFAQHRLLDLAIRNSRGHRLVAGWVRRFAGSRFPPELLSLRVAHEYRVCFHRLTAADLSPMQIAPQAQGLVATARLLATVTSNGADATRVGALIPLYEVYLALRWLRVSQGAAIPRGLLVDQGEYLLAELADKPGTAVDDPWTEEVLLGDAQQLLRTDELAAQKKTQGKDETARRQFVEALRHLRERVAGIERMAEVLWPWSDRVGPAIAGPVVHPGIPPDVQPEQVALAGLVAIHHALVTKQADEGIRFLDACDGLVLSRHLQRHQRDHTVEAPVVGLAAAVDNATGVLDLRRILIDLDAGLMVGDRGDEILAEADMAWLSGMRGLERQRAAVE